MGGRIHAMWLCLLAVERMALVGTGWIISYLVSKNGHSNPSSAGYYLVQKICKVKR